MVELAGLKFKVGCRSRARAFHTRLLPNEASLILPTRYALITDANISRVESVSGTCAFGARPASLYYFCV